MAKRRGIKAIETTYNGYRFRSRLEARWAVWLDQMGIEYRYEHQGFTLDGENYLPDFWLPFAEPRPLPDAKPPFAGYYLEIKPEPLDERECRLLRRLSDRSGHSAYAFAGDPWPGSFAVYAYERRSPNYLIKPSVRLPMECDSCHGNAHTMYEPRRREWKGHEIIDAGLGPCTDCDGTGRAASLAECGALWGAMWMLLRLRRRRLRKDETEMPDLWTAFRAARSARFEFGETPIPPTPEGRAEQ